MQGGRQCVSGLLCRLSQSGLKGSHEAAADEIDDVELD